MYRHGKTQYTEFIKAWLETLCCRQQLSHLSQVFGVGYMNQRELRRIGHIDELSPLIPIKQYAFTKTLGQMEEVETFA